MDIDLRNARYASPPAQRREPLTQEDRQPRQPRELHPEDAPAVRSRRRFDDIF